MNATFTAPTQEDLEAQALKYLKGCCPKDYKEMQKRGELKAFCQGRANAAREYAENLVESNSEPPAVAWRLAIRNIILERESD